MGGQVGQGGHVLGGAVWANATPFPRVLGGGTSTDEGNFSCARTTLFSTTAVPRKRPIIEGRLPP